LRERQLEGGANLKIENSQQIYFLVKVEGKTINS